MRSKPRPAYCSAILALLLAALVALVATGCSPSTASTPSGNSELSNRELINKLYTPGSRQDAAQTVEEILRRAQSVDLVDSWGRGSDQVSGGRLALTAQGVATHTWLLERHFSRKLGDVLSFLAGAGVRVTTAAGAKDQARSGDADGAADDLVVLLPELQEYIDRSLRGPEARDSLLGLLIASGPEHELPGTPRLSLDTAVCPLATLLLAADLVSDAPVSISHPLRLTGGGSPTLAEEAPELVAAFELSNRVVTLITGPDATIGYVDDADPVSSVTLEERADSVLLTAVVMTLPAQDVLRTMPVEFDADLVHLDPGCPAAILPPFMDPFVDTAALAKWLDLSEGGHRVTFSPAHEREPVGQFRVTALADPAREVAAVRAAAAIDPSDVQKLADGVTQYLGVTGLTEAQMANLPSLWKVPLRPASAECALQLGPGPTE